MMIVVVVVTKKKHQIIKCRQQQQQQQRRLRSLYNIDNKLPNSKTTKQQPTKQPNFLK